MAWFSRNKYWLTAASFFALSFIFRFISASQTAHPTGWDGYYYVMQVHSWLEFGHLQSPDFSLIYPYFAAISLIVKDYVLAYQIGVAILSGLLIVAVFYSLLKRKVELGWICIVCAYLLFSPLTTYFVLQFPKNTLGLIFLILFILSSPRHLVFLVLALLTHRMTGAFALIMAVLNLNWKWIVGGAVLVALVSLLPGILHISDLARFKDQFTLIPNWGPLSFSKLLPLGILFKIDLFLISILILLSIYLNRRKPNIHWLIIAGISIFPFFVFEPGSIGHRFFLIAPIAFIMATPFEDLKLNYSLVPISIFSIASIFAIKSYTPLYFDPPNNRYQKIISGLKSLYTPTEFPLVIAHKSLAEMIIFTTDFDALNWLSPDSMQQQRVLRIMTDLQYYDFRMYLNADDVKQLHPIMSGYFIGPEDVWQRFVTAASKDGNDSLMKRINSDNNPHEKRPYFINKGRRAE